MTSLATLFFPLIFTSAAQAHDSCGNYQHLAISTDIAGITWQSHRYDVKQYAEQHRRGTREGTQLHIPAGNGDWCVHFGRLQHFSSAIPGTIFIAVTVGDTTVVHNTDVNDFQVLGLEEGDRIRIEILQLQLPDVKRCDRKTQENVPIPAIHGETRPYTYYNCSTAAGTSWVVIEERVYTVNVNLGQPIND